MKMYLKNWQFFQSRFKHPSDDSSSILKKKVIEKLEKHSVRNLATQLENK